MAVAQTLAHVVIDRNRAELGLQCLAAAARRRTEHDIASRILVSDRRNVTRLAAENIEHAYAILARRNLRQRADPHVIFEVAYALSIHVGLLMGAIDQPPAAAGTIFRCAANCSRPPAFIQSLTLRACSTTSLMSESNPKMRYGSPSASIVSRITLMPRTRFGPPRPITT